MTAQSVVWDTAAIPRDKPPACPGLGSGQWTILAPLFSDANVMFSCGGGF